MRARGLAGHDAAFTRPRSVVRTRPSPFLWRAIPRATEMYARAVRTLSVARSVASTSDFGSNPPEPTVAGRPMESRRTVRGLARAPSRPVVPQSLEASPDGSLLEAGPTIPIGTVSNRGIASSRATFDGRRESTAEPGFGLIWIQMVHSGSNWDIMPSNTTIPFADFGPQGWNRSRVGGGILSGGPVVGIRLPPVEFRPGFPPTVYVTGSDGRRRFAESEVETGAASSQSVGRGVSVSA